MIDGLPFPRQRRVSAAALLLAAAFGTIAVAGTPAAAAGDVPRPTQSPTTPEVRTYCQNIAGAAADARFAWQTKKLEGLEARVKIELSELEAKTAELKAGIAKREEIDRKAGEKLVGIYSKMRPETAATQIATLDDTMAAAVLGQLSPRQASAIFNEIVPERAAKLAALIAGLTPPSDEKKL